MDRFCIKCGNQIQGEAQFCASCGAPVQTAAPEQPIAPEQPTVPVGAPQPEQVAAPIQQAAPAQAQQQQAQPAYQPQPQPQYQQAPQAQPQQPYGREPGAGKKNKTVLFIVIGAAVLLVALIAVLIGTKMFGLLGKAEVDPLVGTWTLDRFEQDDMVLSWAEYEALLQGMGETNIVVEIVFTADGKGSTNFFGDIGALTWENSGSGKYVIYDDEGSPADAVLTGDKLVMTNFDESTVLTFVKVSSGTTAGTTAGAPPVATSQTEFVTDMPYSIFGISGTEHTGLYTGYVLDGKPEDPNGTFVYDDDYGTYVGGWKDGVRSGQGTATWSDEVYVGEWRDGQRTGQGTSTFENGDVYSGEWKDNKYNGQGTYTWPDGRKYVGEWRDGQRTGQGSFTYANGDVYSGEWKDDKRDGYGTVYDADGKITKQGQWKDGEFVE